MLTHFALQHCTDVIFLYDMLISYEHSAAKNEELWKTTEENTRVTEERATANEEKDKTAKEKAQVVAMEG